MKRNATALPMTCLIPLLVVGATDRIDVANAQESQPSQSKTNFIEYSIEQLKVYPPHMGERVYPPDIGAFGSSFGVLVFNGAIVHHGEKSVRVSDFDLYQYAVESFQLSDTNGNIWKIKTPNYYYGPPKKTAQPVRLKVLLKGEEKRLLSDLTIAGKLFLESGPSKEAAGNANANPRKLRYSLDIKRDSTDEQGDRPTEITFTGTGTLNVTWVKDEKLKPNAGGTKP